MSLKNLSARIKIPKLLQKKLDNKRITRIYKKFEKSLNIKKNFVVAVSGGPDSLALSFLAKIYSIQKNLKAKFVIIDHKLRPESTKEAKLVQKILKKFFIKSEILTWKGKKSFRNIQSLARNKRYELLFSFCNKFKIKNVLLGHHQDDLFENFFIRLLRGSGLKGLISLDKEAEIGDKILLRPLLKHKKDDLIFISKHVFNYYVQDPTNNEIKYQRIKIRKLIEELRKDGLDKTKFLKTIDNLKNSNKVVNFYVSKNLDRNTYFSSKKKQLILNKSFFQQPYEVVFRAFSESIKLIGKKYYAVRGKKIDKVINNINNYQSFRSTLGGCLIEKVSKTVIISKES